MNCISELLATCGDAAMHNVAEVENRIAAKYINKITETQTHYEAQLAALKSQSAAQLAEVSAKMALKESQLCERLHLESQSKFEIFANEKKVMQEQIANFQKKYNDLNANLVDEKNNLQSELIAKYDAKMRAEIDRLTQSANSDKQLLREQFEYYREKYEKLNDAQNDEKAKLTLSIRAEYNDIIEKIKKYEQQKTSEQIAEIRKQFDAQLSAINGQFKLQTELQNTLIKTLDPISSYYSGTNGEKGATGENCIYNLLINENAYKSAIIENTSGQSASGDILFSWAHLNCMIEVKNKVRLEKDDTNKFKRDVLTLSETGKINCAIFVSLKSSQFSGRSREIIQLDYVNGIPVVYVYAPPPSNDIHAAIALLENFIQVSNVSTKEQQEMNAHFGNYYKLVTDLYKFYSQELIKKQKELKTINENITKYKLLSDELGPTYARIAPDTIHDNAPDSPVNVPQINLNVLNETVLAADHDALMIQLVERYISFATSKSCTGPLLESVYAFYNNDPRVYEIGLNEIRSRAVKVVLDKRIKSAHLDTFHNFYKTNNRYPNKPAWKTMGILTDHYYKVISRMSDSDQHMSILIGDYCMTKLNLLN